MSAEVEFVSLEQDGREVSIEYRWIGGDDPAVQLILFLHEGLGSQAMWKDFPDRLCRAACLRGLVYSRPGYGRSTPRAGDQRWEVDFMHRQALEILPRLLQALDVDANENPPWILGHSDGGSIALLYAAAFAQAVAGLIVMSPHIMVEAISIDSIVKARQAYLNTDLRARLGRYLDDPDSAFWGWNDIWLDPEFRRWNIEPELERIQCPVLALQGLDDEYGTLAQIHGIAARAAEVEVLELPDCGHSPQRDQPEILLSNAVEFIARHRAK